MAKNFDGPTQNQPVAIDSVDALDSDGHVVERTKLAGKAELFELLKNWLEASHMPTIGVVGKFGGRRCVSIGLDEDLIAVLNVDTKRTAVEQFVEDASERGPEVLWSVVPNRRGRLNKLAFRADGAETPGWYCYLLEPLSAPRKL